MWRLALPGFLLVGRFQRASDYRIGHVQFAHPRGGRKRRNFGGDSLVCAGSRGIALSLLGLPTPGFLAALGDWNDFDN